MKRRLLVLALLSAALPAVTRPAAAQTADPSEAWQTVVGRDLSFRIEMPSPVKESRAAEKEQGHASERLSWSSKRDGEMFDFDYVDYSPGWFSKQDSRQMARDLGRGEAEKAFPRAKFTYVRDEPVALQGWDGYALDIEDAQGAAVMMRTYIVKDRLYRLLVTAKKDPASRAAATRFLDSLRLAQTRPS
ncbi:hypothetical protein [Reyranella sp.]|uniref:hypothetical protein n=1 Tax=Reyranella sp. TaxID=1929291 RepID=UPI003BAA49CB